MQDESKKAFYERPWHGDAPYDPREAVRLRKCCARFAAHREELKLARRYDLLDVGCGVGPLRAHLPRQQFHLVGLEISPQAAGIARGQYDACEVCDVEGPWPAGAEGFDGVHAGAILEHVHDWHRPLNQANRVLRDGGLLVVSTPNLRYWKEVRRLIRGRQPHWLKSMGHVHGYTPGFLRGLVELHGFEVTGLEADRVNLPLVPDTRWVCRRLAGIGSVLILSARLRRRVRVEDQAYAERFPGHKPVGLRSIEVPPEPAWPSAVPVGGEQPGQAGGQE